jgi:hypothetical protein
MSLDLYPVFLSTPGWGLTFTVMRTPEFSTTLQDAPNGFQVRIENWQAPKWHWQLLYDYLADNNAIYNAPPSPFNNTTAFREMLGFFIAKLGSGQSFLFYDTIFNSIGPGLISAAPNPLAQLQLVNDGAGNYYSPIQFHIGGQSGTDQSYGSYVDVTDLQPNGGADHSALSVYANGSLLTYGSQYTLNGPGLTIPGGSWPGLYLSFVGTPTGPITVTCSFYFRVMFEMDSLDIEQFLGFVHTIGGSGSKSGAGYVKLMTAWPPAV